MALPSDDCEGCRVCQGGPQPPPLQPLLGLNRAALHSAEVALGDRLTVAREALHHHLNRGNETGHV